MTGFWPDAWERPLRVAPVTADLPVPANAALSLMVVVVAMGYLTASSRRRSRCRAGVGAIDAGVTGAVVLYGADGSHLATPMVESYAQPAQAHLPRRRGGDDERKRGRERDPREWSR